jgi:molecular chaperone Hsp33
VSDLQVSFLIDGGAARGRIIRLDAAIDTILAGHDYPPLVAQVLGETVVLAAGLAGGLKFDGIFTLQAQGSGAISLLVADITSSGEMRAYARFDADKLAEIAHDPSLPRLLGQGYMAFTVDQGPHTDRYQGIVELTGATLAECAQEYFKQSEQIPTAIILAARPPAANHGWRAGGIILQRMPLGTKGAHFGEEAEDEWRRAVILLASTKVEELLDPALEPERLLFRLYHSEDLQMYEAHDLVARCRCSMARVETTLKSFPRDEIETLRNDEGQVVVTCEYCKTSYSFDQDALDRLYAS